MSNVIKNLLQVERKGKSEKFKMAKIIFFSHTMLYKNANISKTTKDQIQMNTHLKSTLNFSPENIEFRKI